MLYGQTWYQRSLGARVLPLPRARASRQPAAELERAAAALRAAPAGAGDAAAFDDWFGAYVAAGRPAYSLRWRWLYGPTREAMLDAWMAHPASWNAFFRDVNERCGCAVFRVLIATFLRGALGLNMDAWSWEVTRPQPQQGGGGARARAPAVRRTRASPALARAGAAYFRAMERAA